MTCLYKVEGQVNPTNSQSHIRYSFYVKDQHETIKVFFKYYPKDLEDKVTSKRLILESLDRYGYSSKDSVQNWEDFMPLKNHITLSVDDPNGFRGATHRHDYELELTLDNKSSTPGLYTRKNESGMWNITLDIHALVTEECDFILKVKAVS